MKKLIFSVLILLSARSGVAIEAISKAEDINYEWLVQFGKETGLGDHVPHFREIFSNLKVKTLLEFGHSFSTKYFLDSCNKVISVEFVTGGYGPESMKNSLALYRNYSNWIPIVFFSGYLGDTSWAPYKYLGSEHMHRASSFQCAVSQSYAEIDDFYLSELNAFILSLTKSHKIDVALVHGGIYIRGDLVQLLFGKVPVILAHNTFSSTPGNLDDVYGYSKIVTPQNYEEIFIPIGMGTTAWVIKDEKYKKLTARLQEYAQGK